MTLVTMESVLMVVMIVYDEIVTIELMPGNVERQHRRPPKPVR